MLHILLCSHSVCPLPPLLHAPSTADDKLHSCTQREQISRRDDIKFGETLTVPEISSFPPTHSLSMSGAPGRKVQCYEQISTVSQSTMRVSGRQVSIKNFKRGSTVYCTTYGVFRRNAVVAKTVH